MTLDAANIALANVTPDATFESQDGLLLDLDPDRFHTGARRCSQFSLVTPLAAGKVQRDMDSNTLFRHGQRLLFG